MAVLGIPVLEDKYPVTMDMWPIQCKEFNRCGRSMRTEAGKIHDNKVQGVQQGLLPPTGDLPECYSDDLEYVELPKKPGYRSSQRS